MFEAAAEILKAMFKNGQAMSNVVPQVATVGTVPHKDLTDVTVFKGPSGAWTVSEDRGLWMVDKMVESCEIAYADGESHHSCIHPRSHKDNERSSGSYRDETKAMNRAREWSGMEIPATHPVPNRRAAIAHSRKL